MAHFFKLQVDNETNYVLQLQKEKAAPMVRVVVDQKRENDDENQWWRYDAESSTLRTKAGDFCLDIGSDNNLIVNPWYEHAWTQHFAFAVQSEDDKLEVLQIVRNPDENKDGRTVQTKDFTGAPNQLWAYDTAYADKDRPYFMLRNTEEKAVMKIGGSKPKATPIVERAQTGNQDGQLWWYDPAHKTIQCKETEYSLEAQNTTLQSDDRVVTANLTMRSSQQHWRFVLASTVQSKGVIKTDNEVKSRVSMTTFEKKNDNIAFKIVH